jgi:hypothetical protein
MCAFPFHLWTLILGFRDIGWLTERTDAWDAVGVVSYGLVFAFFESLLFFAAVLLLGFLLPRRWDAGRRLSLLFVLVLVLCAWAILSQLFFLTGASLPGFLLTSLAGASHPLRLIYLLALLLVTPTVALPALFVLRSGRAVPILRAVIERLSVLSAFYLFFDVIGLVVIVIRNVA